MRKLKIFDTTLRDGEQAPGNALSVESKLELLSIIDEMGVDYIEAGFPAASEEDFEAVSQATKIKTKAMISVFSRPTQSDIDIADAATMHSKENVQLQLLFVGSEIHLEHKRKITKEEAFKEVNLSIQYARAKGFNNISAGFEDAFRGSREYLKELTLLCLKHKIDTIVYADTVGAACPEEFHDLIQEAKTWIQNKAELSVHCHNDLGLGLANTLAAVKAGADCVQATLCGIGERAGNVAIEELVTTLSYKHMIYHASTKIDTKKMYSACKKLVNILKLNVWPHKPILGKYSFSTAAGIHISGLTANPVTYEFVEPDLFGRKRKFLIGRLSGRSVIREKLSTLGLPYTKSIIERMYKEIMSSKESEKYNDYETLRDLYLKVSAEKNGENDD